MSSAENYEAKHQSFANQPSSAETRRGRFDQDIKKESNISYLEQRLASINQELAALKKDIHELKSSKLSALIHFGEIKKKLAEYDRLQKKQMIVENELVEAKKRAG